MTYPITTLSAAILGLWLVILSIHVIRARGSSGISLGEGGNETLSRRIRAQGNLSEYAPIGLILLFLAEAQNAHYWVLMVSAAALVIGRLAHGYALGFTKKWVIGRVGGMLATFASIVILSLANLWVLVAGS